MKRLFLKRAIQVYQFPVPLWETEKIQLRGRQFTDSVNPPSGIEYAFNAYPITGGSDDESDGSFRKRIMSTFKIPLNYFNKSSIELEIKNIGNIKDCSIKQSDTPEALG